MTILTDEEIKKILYPLRHDELSDSEQHIALAVGRAIEAKLIERIKSRGAVAQWKHSRSCEWYDGHPDNEDGSGPHVVRTLYRIED